MLDGQGMLIEWPERAASFLPLPDLDLHLHVGWRAAYLCASRKI